VNNKTFNNEQKTNYEKDKKIKHTEKKSRLIECSTISTSMKHIIEKTNKWILK
jgi:flagellar biosynthesis/type III secretory pathway M-ring protein FliF/YscJ